MKFTIKHESPGRMRIDTMRKMMSFSDADLLEFWLMNQPGITKAKVHIRTGSTIINYVCSREELVRMLAGFSFADNEYSDDDILSTREVNHEYFVKLCNLVIKKIVAKTLLPSHLHNAYVTSRASKYFLTMFKELWRRKLTVTVLDSISLALSIGRKEFSTAGSVMFLLDFGEIIEEWTRKKSIGDLANKMAIDVTSVWRYNGGQFENVPCDVVGEGDLIRVHVGNMIPFDGVIEQGEVMVNQASLTGESVPISKTVGGAVYAGSVLEEGDCVLRVTATTGDSRYDKIVKMIEQSEHLKSEMEEKASALADKLVPYTLLAGMLTGLFTWNPNKIAAMMMVDFSCALKLAMPLSVLSAMREANDYSIMVKGGKHLEYMANVDTMVFDKTGTLTKATPRVEDVIPFDGSDPDEMLRIAACLEEHFPHSMANAVVKAADERGLVHDEMHAGVEYVVAHGISSRLDGKKAIIGSYHFVFEDEVSVIPEGEEEKFESLSPSPFSQLYLAISGRLKAVICISDPLRDEAHAVIEALRDRGVGNIVMLTGDNESTAGVIAERLDFDNFKAGILPDEKAAYIESERANDRLVVMIGDGINDSPALSAADMGIAIGDGAVIAREIADVVIAAEDLNELVVLKDISDALVRRINQNYKFIMGFNGSLMLLGVLGLITPTTSAMLHNMSTLGISLKSMTNLLRK